MIEFRTAPLLPRAYRVAVFDFDGTLSLIREGWSKIMATMGCELLDAPSEFDRLELEMLKLSGQPSLVQMQKLVEMAQNQQRSHPGAEELLKVFTTRLDELSKERKASLTTGSADAQAWAVPGSHELLKQLRSRGVLLVLASGTVRDAVLEEASLLHVGEFFGERIHAPESSVAAFTKRQVIEDVLLEFGIGGAELIGFGDGFSETVELKRAGGVAIGVASHEAGQRDVNALKRRMLLDLGADAIVPHFDPAGELVATLFGN